VAEEEALDQFADGSAFVGVEAGGGLELEAEVVGGAPFVLVEKQHIRAHAERVGEPAVKGHETVKISGHDNCQGKGSPKCQ